MGDRLGRSEKDGSEITFQSFSASSGQKAVHKRLCMRVMQALAARSSDETLGMSAPGHQRRFERGSDTSALTRLKTYSRIAPSEATGENRKQLLFNDFIGNH
jgi:hypothetical protein